MKDKISIIVPVYNVEKYLSECLESLINQIYKNIEIILINDGSTDSSLKICQKYKKKDNRIKLINKKNEGVSKARNIGVKEATGKYILFVDSDDYLSSNAVETLSKHKLTDTLLIYGYNRIYKNKIIEKCDKELVLDSQLQMKRNIFLNDNIGGFIANKMFEKNVLIENNILFDENLSYCEDLVFVCEYIKYCKKFIYINIPLYNYRMRKSSVSHSFLTGKNINIFDAYDLLLKKIDDEIIINNIKYRYIETYYIFKRFLDKRDVNLSILSDEKNIIRNNCKSIMSKVRILIIKYFYSLGLLYKKLDYIRHKLFE